MYVFLCAEFDFAGLRVGSWEWVGRDFGSLLPPAAQRKEYKILQQQTQYFTEDPQGHLSQFSVSFEGTLGLRFRTFFHHNSTGFSLRIESNNC